VSGFSTGDRYLPDCRDLNRSFPGSPRGSLASRIAQLSVTAGTYVEKGETIGRINDSFGRLLSRINAPAKVLWLVSTSIRW
jgi:predicted deacylase